VSDGAKKGPGAVVLFKTGLSVTERDKNSLRGNKIKEKRFVGRESKVVRGQQVLRPQPAECR